MDENNDLPEAYDLSQLSGETRGKYAPLCLHFFVLPQRTQRTQRRKSKKPLRSLCSLWLIPLWWAQICKGSDAQRVRLGTNLASFDPALVQVVTLAMHQAHYETLEDGTVYGEIPGFQGVYAQANTEEECCKELQSVLEGWIMLGLQLGHEIPDYVVR